MSEMKLIMHASSIVELVNKQSSQH